MNYRYYGNCVDWPSYDVYRDGGLNDMIYSLNEISRRHFLRQVDTDEVHELEESLGYASHPKNGLTMSADCHVQYFSSHLHGERVYGFVWSGIEYVFVKPYR